MSIDKELELVRFFNHHGIGFKYVEGGGYKSWHPVLFDQITGKVLFDLDEIFEDSEV